MKRFFIASLFIFSYSFYGYSQADSVKVAFSLSCDTISKRRFTKLVKRSLAEIKRRDTFLVRELITFIRIGMTPDLQAKVSKRRGRIYQKFQTVYWEKIIEKVSKSKDIGYAPLKGMVGYSKTLNLYITPPSNKEVVPCHNYYYLID